MSNDNDTRDLDSDMESEGIVIDPSVIDDSLEDVDADDMPDENDVDTDADIDGEDEEEGDGIVMDTYDDMDTF